MARAKEKDWAMTLREAAQQALEALKDPWSAGPEGVANAITALRAALEQPDYWEEEARRYAGNADFWRSKYKALEQPDPKCKRHNPCEANASGYCGRCHSEAYP